MTPHLSWEALNSYVDEEPALDASTRRACAAHLAECVECRDTVARLRAIVAAAAELSDVAPPADAWTGISATIERRKSLHLAGRIPVAPQRRRRVWIGAAALTVVAASLLIYSTKGAAPRAGHMHGSQLVTAALPAEVLRIEREYGITADALSAAMSEPRVSRNSPGVVESVARSVAVIDTAIAEARDALIKNPASDQIRDALVRNYQQKIDLLRRVTARASSN